MKSATKTLLVILLLALVAARSPAQSHLAVDLKDPVYPLLELGELKGLLSRLSAVRPYSLSEILRLLDRMWERRELLSPREQEILEQTRLRLGSSPSGWRAGAIRYGQEGRNVQAGVDVRSEIRVNADAPEAWTLESAARAYLRGALTRWLSYSGSFGFTLDRVGLDSAVPATVPKALRYPAYVPYGFTKEWDAYHHSGFREPRFSDGTLAFPTFSYDLGTDIGAQFLDDAITVRFARFRREWGMGDGSLTLSGTARPFLGGELHARLAPWIAIHHVTGGLSDWSREPSGNYSYPDPLPVPPETVKFSYQKLYTLQRMELFPWPWLYASASSSVVGARRLEPGYMAPLIFALIWQNTIGDLDNVGVCVDLAGTLPRWGRVYFSFYADEVADINNLTKMFTRPRNMFALQTGLKVPIPGLPFTGLTFQYTRIEPFTYAHYPTWYADHRLPVEVSYTHDGENLAYALYPNSDEFLVKLWSLPLPRLQAALEYRLVRHGDNPLNNPGDPAILGRPEAYLDYSVGLDSYPDKYFLHDGLYDFNHIVTLTGSYALPWFPATVSLSYSFVYTFWDANGTSLTAPPVQVRNILALSLTVFR
jgi:hypothetical protein